MVSEKFHSSDLRKCRFSQAGRIYLVTYVTKFRLPLFKEFPLARMVVGSLINAPGAKTLAYVVMPDHVHWLLQLGENENLSNEVQKVKSVSAHRINRYLKRKGSVWQSGFHDHALRKEEDIEKAARYIVANPIRAGLVKSVGDYPHWDAIWL